MPLTITEPWSKKHKRVTGSDLGPGKALPHNLSNSFAQPLTHGELVRLTLNRGDQALVDQYNNHSLHYTPNGGSLDLRDEISRLYGPGIGPENVLVFTGAQPALQTAALALLDPSTHTIVFTPGYQSVQEAPLHAGSQLTRIQLTAASGWQIDPRAVEEAIRPNTRYIVINQPHNPTGSLMAPATQRRLAEIADEHGIYIMSDEVYRLLEHDPMDRLPAMADLYIRGISAVTLSKPWGGCGITIGWLAFQDLSLRQRFVDVQYFGTACPSRASEIQAIMTLRASDVILEKNLVIIRKNMELLRGFMRTYSDLFEWVEPKAGAVAFIRFKGPLTTTELGEELASGGISIKPSYCFTPGPITPENDYFRVGFGESIMPAALDALALFVDEHRQAWVTL
jgi:aspartate/methionine/tyrosine aminotransferase